MSDDPATPAPPPLPDNPAALSPDQATSWLEQLGQRTDWRDKLLRNDGATRKLFDALVQKRSESDLAAQIVADADVLPPPGGATNNAGLSPYDVKTGVQSLLADGLTPGTIVELLHNAPVVTPEDFKIIEREFRVKCLGNAEWTQKLLAGDLDTRRQLLAWHTISITSRPLPPTPTSIPR